VDTLGAVEGCFVVKPTLTKCINVDPASTVTSWLFFKSKAAITCATTNSPHSGGIDDAAVASGAWMRVTRGTVTGTITQASLCMTYTEP